MIRKIAGLLLGAGLFARLLVGSGPTETAAMDPSVLEDTANGQVGHFVIVLRRQADLAATVDPREDRLTRRRRVVDALRGEAANSQGDVTAQLDALGARYRAHWLVNAIAVDGGRNVALAMAARPDVLALEPDRSFHFLDGPPETLAGPANAGHWSISTIPWNIQQIDAPAVWSLGDTGQGMVYGEPDTGVKWDHPALKPRYRGWNGVTADHNYNWWDAVHAQLSTNPNPCGYNLQVPCDDVGHGTAITGTAVGDDGGANQIGVAPGATWIGCRDQDQGIGQPSAIVECLEFLLAPTDLAGMNPDPSRGADVINNSYTCPPSSSCDPPFLQDAVGKLRDSGVFVTSAAGNYGSDGTGCGTIQDPISWYASVVSVGGTQFTSDGSDVIWTYSSRGPVTQDGSGRSKPDLVAPSTEIVSTSLSNGYANWIGTSFSGPEVGGVALLLWSAYPVLRGDVATTLTFLEQSAVHLAPPSHLCGGDLPNQVPNNVDGYGRVDALAAYRAVVATPFPTVDQSYLPIVSSGFAGGW
jgi:serine protease AprX